MTRVLALAALLTACAAPDVEVPPSPGIPTTEPGKPGIPCEPGALGFGARPRIHLLKGTIREFDLRGSSCDPVSITVARTQGEEHLDFRLSAASATEPMRVWITGVSAGVTELTATRRSTGERAVLIVEVVDPPPLVKLGVFGGHVAGPDSFVGDRVACLADNDGRLVLRGWRGEADLETNTVKGETPLVSGSPDSFTVAWTKNGTTHLEVHDAATPTAARALFDAPGTTRLALVTPSPSVAVLLLNAASNGSLSLITLDTSGTQATVLASRDARIDVSTLAHADSGFLAIGRNVWHRFDPPTADVPISTGNLSLGYPLTVTARVRAGDVAWDFVHGNTVDPIAVDPDGAFLARGNSIAFTSSSGVFLYEASGNAITALGAYPLDVNPKDLGTIVAFDGRRVAIARIDGPTVVLGIPEE